jgi:hypothetical protein
MGKFKEYILRKCSTKELEKLVINRKIKETKNIYEKTYLRGIAYDFSKYYREYGNKSEIKEHFKNVISNIEKNMIGISEKRQLCLLQSFRKIVTLHLASGDIANFIYDCNAEKRWLGFAIPDTYVNKNGNSVSISSDVEDVSLIDENIDVVEYLWNIERWENHLSNHIIEGEPLKADLFVTEELPHYYPELNLILAGGGCTHRTAEAYIHKRKGLAKVERYDISELIECVKTDGVNWINEINNEPIGREIDDYRIAVIFTLRKMEKKLEKEICDGKNAQ